MRNVDEIRCQRHHERNRQMTIWLQIMEYVPLIKYKKD